MRKCTVCGETELACNCSLLSLQGLLTTGRQPAGTLLNFEMAQKACVTLAAIATPRAAACVYEDGFEQCDGGWLSDQTVRWVVWGPLALLHHLGSENIVLLPSPHFPRYPIRFPEKGRWRHDGEGRSPDSTDSVLSWNLRCVLLRGPSGW